MAGNKLFKVGDKVRVKSGLNVWEDTKKDYEGGVAFARSMLSFVGKVLTIKKIKSNSGYEVEESYSIFTDSMLEPVNKPKAKPEIEYVTKDRAIELAQDSFIKPLKVIHQNPATIFFYLDINGKQRKTVSICEEVDTYDKEIGLKVCVLKAIAKETQKGLKKFYKRTKQN
jgi:hypothetical protein